MSNIVKKKNDLIPLSMQEVEDRIAVIRNQEVIADADVAYLYGVETREVNQAVKNNPEKFPAHYMFELTPSELRDLKSKVLISNVSNNSRRRDRRDRSLISLNDESPVPLISGQCGNRCTSSPAIRMLLHT